jgi:subtilisin family serine protease
MRRLLTIAAGTTLVLGAFACAPPAGPNGQGKVTPPGSLACAPVGGTAHPVVHATDTLRPGQWAFDHYDFEAVWPRTNGAGIKVAVLDSGVDGRVPDLQGQVLPGRSFITTNDAAGVAYDPNPTDPNLGDQDVNPDPNGHGPQRPTARALSAPRRA